MRSATFTDADDNGPFTCTVNYGSGAVAGSVSGDKCYGPTHVYADNGSYSVTITVTDADAATGTKTESETVANAAPVVGALDVSIRPSLENQAVVISADFTDAGVDDARLDLHDRLRRRHLDRVGRDHQRHVPGRDAHLRGQRRVRRDDLP